MSVLGLHQAVAVRKTLASRNEVSEPSKKSLKTHQLHLHSSFVGRPLHLEKNLALSGCRFRSSAKHRSLECRASAVKQIRGGISGEGFRFAVIVSLFNEVVTKALLEGALKTFERHGVDADHIEVVWVPGSFEIPVVAQEMAKTTKFDAVLCIGAVIRGSTTHYDAVANNAASGVLSAGLNSGIPCIFGVLTCETMEQAIDRAGGKLGNKGAEAAVTAIEMADLMAKLRASGSAALEV